MEGKECRPHTGNSLGIVHDPCCLVPHECIIYISFDVLMSQPLLRVSHIVKSYPTGKDEVLTVLRGVSFEVDRGQIVAIVGSSGAGKSTLLHIIGALDHATSGEMHIDGKAFSQFDDISLSKFRNENIGFVFQFHHLLPEFTALENVAIPAMIGGIKFQDAKKKAEGLLDAVHLRDRVHHKPAELSGGEQQRVAVARALVNSPKLILADEPSGNLDEENAVKLHDLMWNLSQERSHTFVLVTHNMDLAKRADTVFRLHDGKLEDYTHVIGN